VLWEQQKMSLQEKIGKRIGISLIAAIIVTLSIFLYDFYSIITKSTNKEAENQIMLSTRTSAGMIREKLNSDLNTVFILSRELSNFKNFQSPEAKQFVSSIGRELPFSIVVISGLDGTYYTNTNSEINLREPQYLIGNTEKNKYISVIYKNALYQRDMIALESPIYKDNRIVGKVSGLYYTNFFNNILNKINDERQQYQIIERDGTFLLDSEISVFKGYNDIYSFLGDASITKRGNARVDDFIQEFTKGTPGISSYIIKEESGYLCYVPIEINNWYLIATAPDYGLNLHTISMKNPTVQLSIRIILLFIVLISYIIWRQMRYRIAMTKNRNELEILNERLRLRNEILRLKAENDLLTGLYNKVTSELMISSYLVNEGKTGRHALFVLDIDDFKHINDELGHFVGDQALTEIANGVDHKLRTTDIKGRIGGDEFVVLLKNIQSIDDVIQKADDICKLFKNITFGENQKVKISGSIGISIYPDHAV
jgi:diguanylate cyclase (GGDEF)-like protein